MSEQSVWEQRIGEARTEIEATRLLCLKAADMMDRSGNKAAKAEIAMIKVKAPAMALKIIDDAVQAFGAAGVSQDTPLALSWAHIRTLRLADGPGRGPQPRDRQDRAAAPRAARSLGRTTKKGGAFAPPFTPIPLNELA